MDNDFESEFLSKVKTDDNTEVDNSLSVEKGPNQLSNTKATVGSINSTKSKNSFVYTIFGIAITLLVVMIIMMGIKLVQISGELSYYEKIYEDVAMDEDQFDNNDDAENIETIKMLLSCVDRAEKQYAFFNDGTYAIVDLMAATEIESGTYDSDWTTNIAVEQDEGDKRTIQLVEDKIVDGGLTFECKKNETI